MTNCKSCWIRMCTLKSKAKAQVQDKERHKSRFFDCYSTSWNHSIATRFLFDLLKISKSTKMSKIWKCPQLVLFKPTSWFVCCNKGHYKLSLESFIKRERSASCASYIVSRVFAPKVLSYLRSMIFLETNHDPVLEI